MRSYPGPGLVGFMPKPEERNDDGYHLVVLAVMSAARRTKSSMKIGAPSSPGMRLTTRELWRVSDLFAVGSRPLPLPTLNSGSIGTPEPAVLPLR